MKNGENWEDKTEWHTVVMWGKRGETLSKFLAKGSYITVQGENRTRSWESQDGGKRSATEVIAKDIDMAGRPPGQQRNGDYEENQAGPSQSRGSYQEDEQTGFG